MSLWRMAWSYLWDRKLTTSLTIISVALSVGLISAVLTLRDETRQRFEEEQNAYDVVVGPPGSPLQLVLNSVYFIDQATGTIPYSTYEKIRQHEDVNDAFPIALGDTYKGFRIVGTEPHLFEYPWESVRGEKRYPFKLEAGRFFEAPMEAVVGYRVANETGLKAGDDFIGLHGSIDMGELNEEDHSDTPYKVVGVLKPSGTSNDRAIFVDIGSVWETHKDGGGSLELVTTEGPQVTSVLVDLYTPATAFVFMQEMNKTYPVKSARPVDEILKLYRNVLQPAVAVLKGIGYIVVVISAISILIGLYLSIIQRRRDLAIMRALGASAGEIFGAVIIEAFLVTALGIVAGWATGKLGALALGSYTARTYGMGITHISTGREELQFFAIVALLGLLAGILPAWQAYQTDVAKNLTAA